MKKEYKKRIAFCLFLLLNIFFLFFINIDEDKIIYT